MEDLFQTFLEETDDNLRLLEEGLYALKEDPTDSELINEVFRAMHTIKGGAGLMGFDFINRVAHHLEDILDRVRQGKHEFSEETYHIMVEGSDLFRALVESGELDGKEYASRGDEIIAACEKHLNGGKKKRTKKTTKSDEKAEIVVPEKPLEFTAETHPFVHIQLRFDQSVFETGTDPFMLVTELEGLGSIELMEMNTSQLPQFDDFDPEKLYISWDVWLKTDASMAEMDMVFIFVKDDHPISYKRETHMPGELDALKREAELNSYKPEAVGKKSASKPLEFDLHEAEERDVASSNAQLSDELNAFLDLPGSHGLSALTESLETVLQVIDKDGSSQEQRAKGTTSSETIRVDTAKLEQMLNYVAEVVIAQSRVKELVFRLTGDRRQNTELSNAFQEVDKIIRYLQEEVMKTTMIPIAGLFSRYQRMIRDLEKETGKRVEVYLEGKDTEVDKNVIEHMTDPLKHIIRNAVDHGLEPPDEREQIGKNPVGKIILRAYHQEGSIFIEIQEDGRGINQKAVLNKAIEKGLIHPQQKLTEQEIFRLLFKPGFSTAKQITDLSGRGVGLDVVLTNIQKMRGEVEVFSELGKGTMFQIKLPLTLAIIDGMMIQEGDDRFILPLTNVVELMRPIPTQIKSVENRGVIVHVRDEYVPYVRLSDILNVHNEHRNVADGILIILREGQKKIALHVDHIIGQEQVVIRSIKENAGAIDGIAGATILGDGQVVTILDVSYLFRAMRFTSSSVRMMA